MIQTFRLYAWSFLVPVFALVATSVAQADPSGAPAPSADTEIKSVYLIARGRPNNEREAARIKSGHVESIELRFHLKEKRLRGGLYFEAIHRKPGQRAVPLGGQAFEVKKADGTQETRYGLSYDDYQYTSGLLKKDVDALYRDWVRHSRNAGSVIATGGSFYLAYGIARWASKREILALSFLSTKAIELYKSKIGFAILIVPTYMAAKEIYSFFNEQQNNLWKGHEMAERDFLHKVYGQAYENAMHGTPIDEKQFDIDGAYERYHAIVSGKDVALPTEEDNAAPAAPVATPLVHTVPLKRDMSFALGAVKNFFRDYYEPNAEDDVAPRSHP